MLISADYYFVGTVLGIFASIFLGFALFLVRYDLLGLSDAVAVAAKSKLKNGRKAVRSAEICLMLLGYFSAFMSCVFAPITLVISLSSLVLLILSALDWYVLKRRVNLVSALSALLIVVAIGINIVNSQPNGMTSTDAMLRSLISLPFLIFFIPLILLNFVILLLLHAPTLRRQYGWVPIRCGRFVFTPFDIQLSELARTFLTSVNLATLALSIVVVIKCLAIAVSGTIIYGVQPSTANTVTSGPAVSLTSALLSWFLAATLLVALAFFTIHLIRSTIQSYPSQSCDTSCSSESTVVPEQPQQPANSEPVVGTGELEMLRQRNVTNPTATATVAGLQQDFIEREMVSESGLDDSDKPPDVVAITPKSRNESVRARSNTAILSWSVGDGDNGPLLPIMTGVYFIETHVLALIASQMLFDDWFGFDALKALSKLAGCVAVWFGVFLLSTFRDLVYSVNLRSVSMRESHSSISEQKPADSTSRDEHLRVRVSVHSDDPLDPSQHVYFNDSRDGETIPASS